MAPRGLVERQSPGRYDRRIDQYLLTNIFELSAIVKLDIVHGRCSQEANFIDSNNKDILVGIRQHHAYGINLQNFDELVWQRVNVNTV